MHHLRIFTFWEPSQNIPAYLRLCMKTWTRFLPEYEVVQLNYTNLDQWIGKGCFDKSLYMNFSLPQQADAIRCAVLKRHGGIWLDTDTVITSDKIRRILDSKADITIINRHIAFLVAASHSEILIQWEDLIRQRIESFKPFGYFRRCFTRRQWDALGNAIVNKLMNEHKSRVNTLNRQAIYACHETNYGEVRKTVQDRYSNFYFIDDFSDFVMKNEQGIILLHNSWTPSKYKRMPEKQFLDLNSTLSVILRQILG